MESAPPGTTNVPGTPMVDAATNTPTMLASANVPTSDGDPSMTPSPNFLGANSSVSLLGSTTIPANTAPTPEPPPISNTSPSGIAAGTAAGIVVGIIVLLAILLFLLFRCRGSRFPCPGLSWYGQARQQLQDPRWRRAPDAMGKSLLIAASEGARDAGVRSPSPPPHPDSEDALKPPIPIRITTANSGLAVDKWVASMLSEQTTPSSGIFTPRPSWCPTAQLRPPPQTHFRPSVPAMKEHAMARRVSLVTAPAITSPSDSAAAQPRALSVRNSMRSVTSCSTCLAPEQPLLYAVPADSTQTPRPTGEDSGPAGAERGGPGDRGTSHPGWSEWFYPNDGAAEREPQEQRANTGSLGAVSIASSGVLTPSLTSFPISTRPRRG
ncbi:hypothetical protein GGTG_12543 [Gaeumannomyces tritici R3-111a-1]|uniref:Uncharacterized protein n=1 Tax=Gaeumannomyces tritici (strain R3-111a-1) TaxID=644352 RepID=J3PGB8_GAET3|nr:hypothetical protein GGTG_12543 [Gaeumannomyces tritici R3-111a-1]EJT69659.1 hypothetical protein GGTG_12543 [Gaeumannomyces tritici R3-111a-1]